MDAVLISGVLNGLLFISSSMPGTIDLRLHFSGENKRRKQVIHLVGNPIGINVGNLSALVRINRVANRQLPWNPIWLLCLPNLWGVYLLLGRRRRTFPFDAMTSLKAVVSRDVQPSENPLFPHMTRDRDVSGNVR